MAQHALAGSFLSHISSYNQSKQQQMEHATHVSRSSARSLPNWTSLTLLNFSVMPSHVGTLRKNDKLDLVAYFRINSPRSTIYNKLYNEIYQFMMLPQNWDSYGASPPNYIAFENSKNILELIFMQDYIPSRAMPSVEGGISILFIDGDKYADIECDNEGDIIVGMSDRQRELISWQVDKKKIHLIDTIERIKKFLNNGQVAR